MSHSPAMSGLQPRASTDSRWRRTIARINRDSAPHLFSCVCQLVRASTLTTIARIAARWWNIELGRNCRFYGAPIFHRLPGSTIRVGDGCEFRSAPWSNYVGINRPCVLATLQPSARLEIGNGCGFSGTIVGCATGISIGDRVMCGANVTITDTDWHALGPEARAAGKPAKAAPVRIGDDTWLGMNVTVLKGVTIGRRVVIGAGSVVTRSIPDGVVAAGYPAVVIRKLEPEEPPE